MRTINKNWDALILIIVVFISCTKLPSPVDDFQEAIFIEGTLVAGKPFYGLTILKTVSLLEDYYSDFWSLSSYPMDKRIVGAFVTISSADTLFMLSDSLAPGIYIADSLSPLIPEPGTRYDLNVLFDGIEVSATTTVPGSVNILEPVTLNDTVTHMDESPYFIEAESENAVAYIPVVGETFPYLYPDSILYQARGYFPNNRWFFSLDNRMKIPWNFFWIFKYSIKIWAYAVDENFFDYYTSGLNSILDPQPPVVYFEGADVIGYFGSASVDSFYVTVLPGQRQRVLVLR